mmetsp:Transcript_34771/g.81472  ORF Transcript_34771/g.81472 Transcript_34771/m.81472 type:complete len:468 (-) Transcript_34771:397-1800(-)
MSSRSSSEMSSMSSTTSPGFSSQTWSLNALTCSAESYSIPSATVETGEAGEEKRSGKADVLCARTIFAAPASASPCIASIGTAGGSMLFCARVSARVEIKDACGSCCACDMAACASCKKAVVRMFVSIGLTPFPALLSAAAAVGAAAAGARGGIAIAFCAKGLVDSGAVGDSGDVGESGGPKGNIVDVSVLTLADGPLTLVRALTGGWAVLDAARVAKGFVPSTLLKWLGGKCGEAPSTLLKGFAELFSESIPWEAIHCCITCIDACFCACCRCDMSKSSALGPRASDTFGRLTPASGAFSLLAEASALFLSDVVAAMAAAGTLEAWTAFDSPGIGTGTSAHGLVFSAITTVAAIGRGALSRSTVGVAGCELSLSISSAAACASASARGGSVGCSSSALTFPGASARRSVGRSPGSASFVRAVSYTSSAARVISSHCERSREISAGVAEAARPCNSALASSTLFSRS